ncbi:MAG TPA: APC family permease [Gammaproteobacteria bacterium]|nr:APC family permease [Gammaproteobacteria bacterium]
MDIINLLFGKPLSSETHGEQRLAKFKALPVFSSDALSSVAYATEEILHVLVLAGVMALGLALPIAVAICLLIAILAISYRQTIFAYPNGGGAFTVARENLGEAAGLIAAAALLIDYVLTVAVSVTAGIHAVVSAFPILYEHEVGLSLISVAFIAVMNLRGVRESATAFAFPTYAFIFLVLLLVGMGSYDIYYGIIPTHHIHSHTRQISELVQPVAIILILRAFSAGCTAMTGIECVANGVPVFEKPESRNAAFTLVMLAGLLILMFFGVTYLADHLMLMPLEQESILSQIAHHIYGNGFLYYALQFSTMAILLLAANTSFAGFPRLASILAEQKYLPKQLTSLGDRLSFSNGIVVLALVSALLITIFHGKTHLLIPLYAVGVFSAFSLSQLGMVSHWFKKKTIRWRFKAFINGLGFVATTVALAVIIESKFIEGAWLVVLCVPILLMGFYKVHHHYIDVDRELSMTTAEANEYLAKISGIKPKVILPVSRIHRGTLTALNFAQGVSDDVTAVVVALDASQTKMLEAEWKLLDIKVPLVVLESPYRAAIDPLKNFIRSQDNRDPERGLCMLVFPQAIPTKWWHDMLHNQRSLFLKASLMFNRKHKGGTRVFVDVPYQLER